MSGAKAPMSPDGSPYPAAPLTRMVAPSGMSATAAAHEAKTFSLGKAESLLGRDSTSNAGGVEDGDPSATWLRGIQRGRRYEKSGRPIQGRPLVVPVGTVSGGLVVHRRHGRSGRSGLGDLGDHGLGGEDHGRDAGSVLQGVAGDLHRVDDTALEHGAELADLGVVAVVVGLLLHVVEDYGAFGVSVLDDELEGLFEGAADDGGADGLITAKSSQAIQSAGGANQGGLRLRERCLPRRRSGWRRGHPQRGPCAP